MRSKPLSKGTVLAVIRKSEAEELDAVAEATAQISRSTFTDQPFAVPPSPPQTSAVVAPAESANPGAGAKKKKAGPQTAPMPDDPEQFRREVAQRCLHVRSAFTPTVHAWS